MYSNLSKEKNLQKNYCQLYSLENKIATGEIEFFFKCPDKITLHFEILDNKFKVIETLVSKEFNSGSHILRYDSIKLSDGVYYYQLRTENQKTYKKMEIKNHV
ncbi:MAG: hypothetical protein HYU67_03965 [Flavobacteriia bacterium]|nr:hypothetical protein [Flavobacteriia bacterium]